MSCFHPLKGFKIGTHPSGKDKYFITSYNTVAVKKIANDQFVPVQEIISSDFASPLFRESIDIPCGHCVGCLLDRSRQWADRCMLEAQYHENCSFITLTYNDEHLPPVSECYDPFTGEVIDHDFHSLNKRDFQLFMKRLRKELDKKDIKIRFFMCGEYGSEHFRPHYHAIIFGYDFPDKVLFKKNFNGDNYYISKELNDLWSDKDGKPIGYAMVCDLDWNCAAYVSRYCLKKRYNDLKSFYEAFNLVPEFNLMSRRPGIARQYYDDHVSEIYKTERIPLPTGKGAKILRPPKYFDKLYDVDYPSDMERIKKHRKEYAEYKKMMELEQTDLDYLELLKVKEYDFHKKTSLLNDRKKVEL